MSDTLHVGAVFPGDDADLAEYGLAPKRIGTSPWHLLGHRELPPARPGVYIAIAREYWIPDSIKRTLKYTEPIPTRVLYVGSSSNLRNRLCNHRKEAKQNPKHWLNARGCYVSYRNSLKYGDWAMVELRLIRRLRPDHNKNVLGAHA